jgi:hypothetical protein
MTTCRNCGATTPDAPTCNPTDTGPDHDWTTADAMKTAPEMAWTDHPCTACGTGYRACCQFWVLSKMCCKDCNHPTRWEQHAMEVTG